MERDRELDEAPRDEVRCAFCHAPDPDEDCESCPRCASVLHPECWAESGRCPTLGCGFAASDDGRELAPTKTPVPSRRVSPALVALALLLFAFVALSLADAGRHEVEVHVPTPKGWGR